MGNIPGWLSEFSSRIVDGYAGGAQGRPWAIAPVRSIRELTEWTGIRDPCDTFDSSISLRTLSFLGDSIIFEGWGPGIYDPRVH
jgi:hypothetical protein